jgi:hypothetical protein
LAADDGDFAAINDVVVVHKPAVEHRLGLDLHQVWVVAVDREGAVFGAAADFAGGLNLNSRGDEFGVFELLLEGVGVLVVEPDEAAGLESAVWHGGLLAPHEEAVGGDVREVALYPATESVAGGEQYDQDEDAPEHTECGEEGARFVAPHGGEDFLPGVAVEEGDAHGNRR